MSYKVRSRFWITLFGLIIVVCGSAITVMANKFVYNSPLREYFSSAVTVRAVWDWTSIQKRNDNELRNAAHQLKLRQINAVFVDISSVSSKSSESIVGGDSFVRSLSNYIAIMKAESIQVYAAAGNTDWSKPEQQDTPLHIQNYVYQYNMTQPKNQFSGIEFDIESYNQNGFAQAGFVDKGAILTDYLDMVSKLIYNQQSLIKKSPTYASTSLGFTIPYWYDNENKNIRSVTWREKTGPVLYHLLDQLNQLPSSNVVVMAYRNAASGNDGTVAHARTEVAYAQAKAPKVKVLIGQETTKVDPPKITFYGHSMVDFSQEVSIIANQFKLSGVFGGIAVNNLPGFLNLRNPEY